MSASARAASRPTPPGAVGILLAAGEGRRMGRPKALVVGDDGEPWLVRGVRVLRESGCAHVIVVLGAEAARVRALLAGDPAVRVVEAAGWQEGIGASLRAGLAEVDHPTYAVITLVDLPELRPEAIRRVAARATETTLRQAFYAGRPGHPVVIGAAHFAPLGETLHGDIGARPYLRTHDAEAVDCTDLGGGDDVDAPPLHAR
ncbi:nucleotidyltransferase family protein [Herbiconiux sp. CPCC 205763]|uniref:Nucleotidyltransferase family protein n=1 Tax=Herbiconiux aconitum TaxID=2970913 RepID=A0ABT2GTQ0_9MICO|nr:nucleotidyltransferase family protein [Herbiconiux aconitum]MCS5718937.1 nucleotidyltransferase family protein [Herbiconiux aconitum]